MSGAAHAEDWVTVTGIEWSGQAFILSSTHQDNYSKFETRSQYHLLVSSNDPGLSPSMTLADNVEKLDSRARSCPVTERPALLQAYDQLLHEAQEKLASARPQRGIPVVQELEKPSDEPNFQPLESNMADVRTELNILAARTEEERATLRFKQQQHTLRSQIGRLLQAGISTTITGRVEVVPDEVVMQYRDQMHLSPSMQIRKDGSPLGFMMVVFIIACAGLAACLVWLGVVKRPIGKQKP